MARRSLDCNVSVVVLETLSLLTKQVWLHEDPAKSNFQHILRNPELCKLPGLEPAFPSCFGLEGFNLSLSIHNVLLP